MKWYKFNEKIINLTNVIGITKGEYNIFFFYPNNEVQKVGFAQSNAKTASDRNNEDLFHAQIITEEFHKLWDILNTENNFSDNK